MSSHSPEGPDPRQQLDTSDRVVLVTGAGHGLGLEVARQLAEAGDTVIVCTRDAGQAEDAVAGVANAVALPFGLDVTAAASVQAAAEWVDGRYGRLDVLVNNAAARPHRAETVTNADLDSARQSLDTTVFGTWRMIQAFLPLLRRSAHPRVVNVSSGAGSHTDPAYGIPLNGGQFASHSIGKAALNALTATLAAELADSPVIVNAVCPGVTVADPSTRPGARTPHDSAGSVIWATRLPDDGPRGSFTRDGEPVGW